MDRKGRSSRGGGMSSRKEGSQSEIGDANMGTPSTASVLKASMSEPVKSTVQIDPMMNLDVAVVSSEPILDSYYMSPSSLDFHRGGSNPNLPMSGTEMDVEDSEEEESESSNNAADLAADLLHRDSSTLGSKMNLEDMTPSQAVLHKKSSKKRKKDRMKLDRATMASIRQEAIVTQMKRRPKIKLWARVRREIKCEMEEVDIILGKLGFPPQSSINGRCQPYNEYESTPNPKTCFVKDYADHHLFPFVLPAIRALISFAQKNRVLQCRSCTFNALDYFVEYIYNNNPLYPERALNPVPLHEIPFAKAWLKNNPRQEYPAWLMMDESQAALIIQRNVKGYLVRKRPEIQEMRQFWTDCKTDSEIWKKREEEEEDENQVPIYSPYYDSEFHGEDEREGEGCAAADGVTKFMTHSDTCFVCTRFREFLLRQKMHRLASGQMSSVSIDSLESIQDKDNEEETHAVLPSMYSSPSQMINSTDPTKTHPG